MMPGLFWRSVCLGFGLVIFLTLTGSTAAQDQQDAELANLIVSHPEAKLLARYPGIARRSETRLDVVLEDGDYIRFEDTCPDASNEGKCHKYELINYLPATKIAVLVVQYYEWHTAILIDRESGRQFDADDLPNISPDGRYLAIVSANLMNEYFNVQVIRHGPGGFARVADKLDNETCQFKAWQSGSAFTMICKDATEHYREKRVAPDGGDRWSVSLTGQASSEQEFNRLVNLSYEYN